MNTLKKLALFVAVFTALPSYSQASLQPAAPAPAAEAHMDSVLVSAPEGCCCQYNPCIAYRHAIFGRCCDCCQSYQNVLQVKDPCTCCVVAVPVCLPVCCTGTPEVCTKCGLFGRSVTRFDYCCGVSVVVAINGCGGIAVTYRGF